MPLGYEGDHCIWSYDRYTKEGVHFEGGYILGAPLCGQQGQWGRWGRPARPKRPEAEAGPSAGQPGARSGADRGLRRANWPSCLVFLIGAAVDDQLVELWQWSKDISKTDKESGVEARLKPKGPKDDWLGFTWFGDFDIYK